MLIWQFSRLLKSEILTSDGQDPGPASQAALQSDALGSPVAESDRNGAQLFSVALADVPCAAGVDIDCCIMKAETKSHDAAHLFVPRAHGSQNSVSRSSLNVSSDIAQQIRAWASCSSAEVERATKRKTVTEAPANRLCSSEICMYSPSSSQLGSTVTAQALAPSPRRCSSTGTFGASKVGEQGSGPPSFSQLQPRFQAFDGNESRTSRLAAAPICNAKAALRSASL